jgi:hypothetical protein
MVRQIVVFIGTLSLWHCTHRCAGHIVLVCVTSALACLAALATFHALSCQSVHRQITRCPMGRLIVVFSSQFFMQPQTNPANQPWRIHLHKEEYQLIKVLNGLQAQAQLQMSRSDPLSSC